MKNSTSAFLVAVIAGAGFLAWRSPVGSERERASEAESPHSQETERPSAHPLAVDEMEKGGELPSGHPPINGMQGGGELPSGHPPVGGMETSGKLPSGHPPIDGMQQGNGGLPGQGMAVTHEPTAMRLAFQVPPSWQEAPNPNAMRLRTYRLGANSSPPTELSVTRAGGSVEENTKRWVDQFDASKPRDVKVDARTVGALRVHVVDVKGTFGGGMMGGESARPNARLLGAVVETEEGLYFFKVVGTESLLASEKKNFDALVQSLRWK